MVERDDGVSGDADSFAHFDRRIAYSFGALILALMVSVLLGGGAYYRGLMEAEQDKLSTLVSKILASSVSRISFSGKYHARLLAEELVAAQPDIRYILVADEHGRVLAHSDPAGNDKNLDEPARRAAETVLLGRDRVLRQLEVDGEPVREITVPYLGGYDNRLVGVIQVGLSDRARVAGLRQGMVFLAVLVLALMVIGVLVTRRIAQRFGRPVIRLAGDLSATLNAIPDPLFELDREGRYHRVSASREDMLTVPRNELLGRRVQDVLPAEAAEGLMEALDAAAGSAGSAYGRILRLPLPEGDRWFELSVARKAAEDNDPTGDRYIVLSRDVTERKQAAARLEFMAGHDALTGLPNRLLLNAAIERGIERARRSGHKLALLMLDLDRFKDVNDSYGHDVGDQLLCLVAKKLEQRLRAGDMVCRLGGDEFTILLEGVERQEDAGRVAQELIAAFSVPWKLPNDREAAIGATIGIALAPDHGTTPEALLQHADSALYRAKAEGRGRFKYFSDDLTRAVQERIDLENRLRRALAQGELRLHYQPQAEVVSGRIIGVEALVRWQDPDVGMVPPSRFIALAEDTGLIDAIGTWVLREACSQGRRWIDQGLPPLTLAVNVSPHQLAADDFCARISAILEETGFPANRLELELTESTLMDQRDEAMETLLRLRVQGIRLAIDDFGTGYSSLAYLKRFPLDVLKIDKSFVDDIPRHEDDMEIAATIVAMGHTLHFTVLAEGVETQEQLDFLRRQGCDHYQGFLFSPPLPAEAAAELIKAPREHRSNGR